MIGEAWIDLREVIVTGGGQNDLWHQLYFKGKTAGEIRVEMTYYDSRPQDEVVLEKKREKERRQLARMGSPAPSATAAESRQLGPREVKRRPLPPGPPTSDAPRLQDPQAHYSNGPDKGLQTRAETSERVWNYPDNLQDEYATTQSLSTPACAPTGFPPRSDDDGSGCQDYEDSHDPREHEQEHDSRWYDNSQQFSNSVRFDNQHAPQQSLYRQSPEEPGWNNSPPPLTPRSHQTHSPISIASSPPVWHSPSSLPSTSQPQDPRNPSAQRRGSISPVKFSQYRDSPLRQSITQYDASNDFSEEPSLTYEHDAPPPPPAHRTSFGQPAPFPLQTQSYQLPQVPPHEQSFNAAHLPLDAQSPLQVLERNFDPYYQAQALPHSPLTPDLHAQAAAQKPPIRGRSHDDHIYDARPFNSDENFSLSHGSGSFESSYQADEPPSYSSASQTLSNGYDASNESPNDYGNRGRAQQHQLGMQHELQVYRSQVPLVRPRAISPNVRGMLQRKSVSPHPTPGDDRGSNPWSPDSYDSLNTASPTSVLPHAEVPDRIREAEHQREVDQPCDLEPIIGNDGRVIDPSDHLPVDTWAPEYQRNNRKPEHVIRYKTKDETVRGGRMTSSPHSARPLSVFTTPSASPSAQSATSPGITSPTKGGRNRLQKQRPLPAQPFQHSNSSPAGLTKLQHQSTVDLPTSSRPDLPQHRHWSTPSPRSTMPGRPSPSEYSLVNGEGHDGSPISSYASRPPPISRKEPFQEQDYSSPRVSPYTQGRSPPHPRQEPTYNIAHEEYLPASGMDPLSVEMSMIDIGPSRGGKTVARFSRGYGM
jgi:hypothetical protein